MAITSIQSPALSSVRTPSVRNASSKTSLDSLAASGLLGTPAGSTSPTSLNPGQSAFLNALNAALSNNSADNDLTGSTPPPTAFVTQAYTSGTANPNELSKALSPAWSNSLQSSTPSEDAPKMNALGQVTGLLLNERA